MKSNSDVQKVVRTSASQPKTRVMFACTCRLIRYYSLLTDVEEPPKRQISAGIDPAVVRKDHMCTEQQRTDTVVVFEIFLVK